MATHNGQNWIDKQIESIIHQCKVNVTIFISDDHSNDGTFEYLSNLAKNNNRIVILPKASPFGSAAKNFYRLICEVNLKNFDYIALSDQDDIWNIDKLYSHMLLLEKNNADAVSSNVTAFWENGKEVLINKSQSQKKYDFLFEGPGPGCSFLITPWIINKVKFELLKNSRASNIALHDWLIYAICRAYKKKWIISPISSLRYRQHSSNVLGANSGLKAAYKRIKFITNGWYRNQVKQISEVVCEISINEEYFNFRDIIRKNLISDRFKLIAFALEGRRRLSERLTLTACILLFIF
jgi:rhamnosyltransferase